MPPSNAMNFRRLLTGSLDRQWLARQWHRHWLITVVAAASLLPRILASLAFRPALFTPDSFGYMSEGVHLTTGTTNPAGYPILLVLLSPFHSLLVVTALQHLMGIAIGVIVYAVLRHWGLPAWGAVLAACPTLFDPRQIALESYVLPDLLYMLLTVVAVAVLLRKGQPAMWRCALAGLALAWATVTRGNGIAIIAAVLLVLIIGRAGWRRVAVTAAAFAVPVLGYMGVFQIQHGQFAITNSDGFFIWSRTMSFANCAVIKPPADLLPLCPGAQPGHPARPTPAWSVPAMLDARSPATYLWDAGVWWRHDAHPGINPVNNALAMQFALDAIRAQPGGYLRTVASGVAQTFLATDRQTNARDMFFTSQVDVRRLDSMERLHLHEYAGTTANSYPVQPFAYFLYLYQQPIWFSGIAFLLVVLAGLGGVIWNWRRRGGPGLLPWVAAAAGIVAPVAMHEYHYRYAIPAIPIACIAAGLAFARRPAPTLAPPGLGVVQVPAQAGAPGFTSGTVLGGQAPAPDPVPGRTAPPAEADTDAAPRLAAPVPGALRSGQIIAARAPSGGHSGRDGSQRDGGEPPPEDGHGAWQDGTL